MTETKPKRRWLKVIGLVCYLLSVAAFMAGSFFVVLIWLECLPIQISHPFGSHPELCGRWPLVFG